MNSRRIALLTLILICYLNCQKVSGASSDLILNSAEQYILKKVADGEAATFKKPNSDEFLECFVNGENRIVRGHFLERMLTGNILNLTVKEYGIKIENANILDTLHLNNIVILYPISLRNCSFYDHTNFSTVTFTKDANFSNSTFHKSVNFGASVFSSWTYFINCNFKGEVQFSLAHFADSDFGSSSFSNKTEFIGSTFSGKNSFFFTKFLSHTDFTKSVFFNDTEFVQTFFAKTVSFKSVTFNSTANFHAARFLDSVDFSDSNFRGESKFLECLFPLGEINVAKELLFQSDSIDQEKLNKGIIPEKFEETLKILFSKILTSKATILTLKEGRKWQIAYGKIKFIAEKNSGKLEYYIPINYRSTMIFDNVTGFSNMLMEWVYDPTKFDKEKKLEQINRRGIKNHLRYDETFYIALIKNYNEIGWFTEANDAYFTYRSEKRKMRSFFLRIAEFIFLELTFGYGVRPINLLGTFIIILLIPTFLYRRFIHSDLNIFAQNCPFF